MSSIHLNRQWVRTIVATIMAAASLLCIAAAAANMDFVAAVVATRPVAYYRLDSTSGKSVVGMTTYKSVGGVTSYGPGAPVGMANNKAATLNGADGYILTTQMGGVGETASMMAWVNLAQLPSEAGRFLYVMGESQNANDLDLQFENDNVLRFYTAAGGHLSYAPASPTLVGQWHMIVVTIDTATQTRVIYWDGKNVAADKGGGRAGKTSALSMGASTVFGGRWFKGEIDEVALWNRALRATEVTGIYAASGASASAGGQPSASEAMSGSGPFATKAKSK